MVIISDENWLSHGDRSPKKNLFKVSAPNFFQENKNTQMLSTFVHSVAAPNNFRDENSV